MSCVVAGGLFLSFFDMDINNGKKFGVSSINSRLFPPFVLLNMEQFFYFTQKKTNAVRKREPSEIEMIGAAASSNDSQPLLSKVNLTRDLYCIHVRFCLFHVKSDRWEL